MESAKKKILRVLMTLILQTQELFSRGVEGAYSQLAMKEYFGDKCDSYNVETWKDAMEDIKKQ